MNTIRITKVYTKKGDKGLTKLADKTAISKASCYSEVLGNLDELNAFLGLVNLSLSKDKKFSDQQKKVMRIQNELFDLGAQMARVDSDSQNPYITDQDVIKLEQEIDAMNSQLPVLNSFILPHGDEAVVSFHLARTVCRRAERSLVALNEEKNRSGVEIKYLNRLSDWLFVVGRYVAQISGCKEILWVPGKR